VTHNILLNPLSQQGKRINVAGFTPPKGQLGFDIDYAAADSGFFDAERKRPGKYRRDVFTIRLTISCPG